MLKHQISGALQLGPS